MLQFEAPTIFWIWTALLPFLLRWSWKSYADLSRRRRALAAAVRIISLLLVTGAIARPVLLLPNTQLAALFLVDVSESVSTEALEESWARVESASRELGVLRSAGLVLFAGEPRLVRPVGRAPIELDPELRRRVFHRRERDRLRAELAALDRAQLDAEGSARHAAATEELAGIERWREEIGVDDTNLESAHRLARTLLPEDARRRLVLVSDGNETRGDLRRELRELARGGFSVHVDPRSRSEAPEVIAESLVHPAEVRVRAPFDLEIAIAANRATRGTVRVYRDGFLIATEPVELREGRNLLTVPRVVLEEGFHEFHAVVEAEDDTRLENNVTRGAVAVTGRPKVLLIEGGEPEEARWLEEALAAEEIQVEIRPARAVPEELNDLLNYDVLMLSDVPADAMSPAQMTMIRRYVREMGGGFVMLGGEHSFGLGGYYRTPIEDALPVKMPIRKDVEKPNLALVLVIDKSGSMSGDKIELAKESAIASAEVLKDRDQIGVVAFDGDSQWICPITHASERNTIIELVSQLEAGGGTNIYPALEDAHGALRDAQAKLKHIILLSDGQTQGEGYEELASAISTDDITISAVGIGEGADEQLLTMITEVGGGEYYFTDEFSALPQIITRETLRASKSMLIEEPFVPRAVELIDAMKGIDLGGMPFLLGYVATTPKERAKVGLVSEYGDPILAYWSYGLGRSIAFTSDAKTRWAGDWIGWEAFSKFWAQIVRSTMSTGTHHDVRTSASAVLEKGVAHLTFDVRDRLGRFRDDAAPEVALFGPEGDRTSLEVEHVAPGLYRAEFPIEEYGDYYRVLVLQRTGEEVHGIKSLALTESYSPEFRTPTPDLELLRALAEETGGRFAAAPEELWEFEGEPARSPHEVWFWWLVAACALLPIDIALRRL